jgi:hypothetical protein
MGLFRDEAVECRGELGNSLLCSWRRWQIFFPGLTLPDVCGRLPTAPDPPPADSADGATERSGSAEGFGILPKFEPS